MTTFYVFCPLHHPSPPKDYFLCGLFKGGGGGLLERGLIRRGAYQRGRPIREGGLFEGGLFEGGLFEGGGRDEIQRIVICLQLLLPSNF